MSTPKEVFHELMHKIGKLQLSKNPTYTKYDFKIIQEGKENVFQFDGLYVVEFSFESNISSNVWIVKLKGLLTNRNINNDKLYYNKHLFYTQVLPVIDKKYSSLFPPFVYSQANGDQYDCIVMEKLEEYGPVKFESFYVDENHLIKMIESLSKFHASTFILKETNRSLFDNICQKIQKLKTSAKNEQGQFASMKTTFMAAADYVEKHLEHNKEILSEFRKKFERIESYYEQLTTSEEPMATIVHGDYNAFNLLFKYDSENHLEAIKIIDYQIITHGSPAIDLSFLLYLNADYDLREKNLIRFLDIYYESLVKELQEYNESNKTKIDLNKYSRESFIKDYKKFMMQGFGIAIGFKVELLAEEFISSERIEEILTNKQSDEYIANALKTEFLTKDVKEHVGRDLHAVLKFLESDC